MYPRTPSTNAGSTTRTEDSIAAEEEVQKSPEEVDD